MLRYIFSSWKFQPGEGGVTHVYKVCRGEPLYRVIFGEMSLNMGYGFVLQDP